MPCHAEERVRGHGTQHLQGDSSRSLLQPSLTVTSFQHLQSPRPVLLTLQTLQESLSP